MKFKQKLSLILALVMTFVTVNTAFADTYAQEEEGKVVPMYSSSDYVTYAVEGGNIYIDRATGTVYIADENIISAEIPSSVDGVTVTSIGNGAFAGNNLLKSVTVPESVTFIDREAFNYCNALTNINVSQENTDYASVDGVLFNKNFSEIIHYPAGKTNDRYIIPDSVTSVGALAFRGCDFLTSIDIPDSVTSIGDLAFYECSFLTSINVSEENNYYADINGALFNKDLSEIILYPRGSVEIPYIIPDTVTSVGAYAFNGCDLLKDIRVPEGVTFIGEGAFKGCSSLTSINIPEGVTSVESDTFNRCRSLTSITIPENVTFIGDYAFYGCSSLTSIDIPDSVTSMGYWAFGDCSSLTDISLPTGITSIEMSTFEGCDALTSIDIPNSVTSIGDEAFCSCSSLTNITMHKGLTHIGGFAFCDCSALTKVYIPDGVTSIGWYAFKNCGALTSVYIPESVTSIGENAFINCTSLTEIYCTKGSYADNKALYPENTEIKYEEAQTYLYGDADGNNKLEASDAAAVLQKVLKSTYKLPLEDLTPDYEKYLDVDGNGKLEASDAAMILQKVLKSTYQFSIEK